MLVILGFLIVVRGGCGDGGGVRCSMISNVAALVISDPHQRAIYDLYGVAGLEAGQQVLPQTHVFMDIDSMLTSLKTKSSLHPTIALQQRSEQSSSQCMLTPILQFFFFFTDEG